MTKVRVGRVKVWAGLLLLAVVLSGCQSLGYYRQAAQGQVQIWSRTRPIGELMANPQTPAPLQARLKTLLEMRDFARRELRLRVDRDYEQYADLGRKFVVWNVYAAPEFSLEPKSWWYPFVGRLKYRGYFVERSARAYGTNLVRKHYDVHVGGVVAYSTLGWFRDPVLNTWLNDDQSEVAEILFHELAHQRVFASGDTDFNEAFATAVAQEGVRRWFLANRNVKEYETYLAHLRHSAQFVRLIMDTRARLRVLYGETEAEEDSAAPKPAPAAQPPRPEDLKRQEKARLLAGLVDQYRYLKAQWGGDTTYDKWFARPINNARLNTVAAYYRWVPAFQALLERNGADLEKFYTDAGKLARLSKAERKRQMLALLPHPPAPQNVAVRSGVPQ